MVKKSRYKIGAPRAPEDRPLDCEEPWGNGCEIRGCLKRGRIHRICADLQVRELCAEHEIEETGCTAEIIPSKV